jgi:hypothetical protein
MPLPVFLVLAIAGAFAAAMIAGGFKEASMVAGVAVAGALASMSYIPLARLSGTDFYEPIQNLTPFQSGDDIAAIPFSVGAPGFHGFARWAVPAVILGAVGGLVLLMAYNGRRRAGKMIGLCGIAAAIVLLYDLPIVQLDPYYADRLAQVAGPSLAIALGVGFAAFTSLLSRERLVSAALLLGISVSGLMTFARVYPAGAATQETIAYESTIRITERIAHDYERFTYTVVGVPQQRQVVLGDGWFIEAWVFARDASMRGARDPGYQMPARKGEPEGTEDTGTLLGIPTQDVFVFVEKEPFEGPRLAADGPSEEYYFDPLKRGRIMSRMYLWAETYMHFHTDMSVYHEDDQIKVYRINRTPDLDGAVDAPEFKDYTWYPGRLFNFGPTSPKTVIPMLPSAPRSDATGEPT